MTHCPTTILADYGIRGPLRIGPRCRRVWIVAASGLGARFRLSRRRGFGAIAAKGGASSGSAEPRSLQADDTAAHRAAAGRESREVDSLRRLAGAVRGTVPQHRVIPRALPSMIEQRGDAVAEHIEDL